MKKCEKCGVECFIRKKEGFKTFKKRKFCSSACANSTGLAKTHGMEHTRFYTTFYGILARCNRPSELCYPRYGGRGIKCFWKSFEEFRDDMHESYLEHVEEFGEKQTQIDRIDNEGNYCKKNCRWATWKEQANNKRNNRLLTFKGETLSALEWGNKFGFRRALILQRLDRNKWSIEKTLTTPAFIGRNQFS